MSENAIARQEVPPSQLATRPLEEVLELRRKVVQLMTTAMKEGVDYGTIPGLDKPSLWQPGAQKIFSLFQLDCTLERQPDSIIQQNPPFILHSYLAKAIHVQSGREFAQGVGSCNSGEEKYGWRKQKRKCPQCGKNTIHAGNPQYNNGVPNWICWKKKDGCGAKFAENDPAITGQPEGRVANENIWEQENTIRKMAAKRAEVHLALNLGLSDIFTQDVEGMAEFGFVQSEQEDLPAHREKHEHFSTLCKVCLDLGVPEGEKVLLMKEHIYLRSLGDDHGPEFGTLKYCQGCRDEQKRQSSATSPAPMPPAASVSQETAIPETSKPAQRITKNFEFLGECGKYKKLLGDGIYYGILKKFANADHANEITDRDKQVAVFRQFVAAAKKLPASPQDEATRDHDPRQPGPITDKFTDRIVATADEKSVDYGLLDSYLRRDNAGPSVIEARLREIQAQPPMVVQAAIQPGVSK